MCTLHSMQKRLHIIPLIIEKVNLFLKLIIYESIPKINTFFVFLEPGFIFEPKGYKGTSIIMYVFNSIFGAILYFILYVRNFQKFIYPRNHLSKTYKIIQFPNVRFRIMYVFERTYKMPVFLVVDTFLIVFSFCTFF